MIRKLAIYLVLGIGLSGSLFTLGCSLDGILPGFGDNEDENVIVTMGMPPPPDYNDGEDDNTEEEDEDEED